MLLFLFLISCFLLCRAQEVEFEEDSLVNLSRSRIPMLLEAGVSAASYQGDLSSYQKWTQAFHLGLLLRKQNKFSHKFSLNSGFINADNKFYRFTGGSATPNTFFRTNFLTLHYELRFAFYQSKNFQAFVSQGIGMNRFRVKNEKGEILLNQLNTRAEGEAYSATGVILPTGLGAYYLLSNGFGLSFQLNLLNTLNDYLDNISLWGNKNGNDNVLLTRFSFLVPLKKINSRLLPPKQKKLYTH